MFSRDDEMTNNNKDNNNKRPPNKNVVTNPAKDLQNRYCQHCNTKLVHDDRHNIFKCQICNCTAVLSNTQPDTKLRTNFPTFSANEPNNKLKIVQSQKDKLPRSEYAIQKNLAERNKEEANDPYLNMLKQNSHIKITNIEYYSVEDFEYQR